MDIQQAITKLATSDPQVQTTAAEWCAQHAESAGPAAVLLVGHLQSDNSSLRDWCTSALESLGPPPEEQLAALADLIDSPTDDVAYWAITLLGRSRAAAAPYAEKLQTAAQSGRTEVLRKRAAWAAQQVSQT
jgi:HEAT repeat protein